MSIRSKATSVPFVHFLPVGLTLVEMLAVPVLAGARVPYRQVAVEELPVCETRMPGPDWEVQNRRGFAFALPPGYYEDSPPFSRDHELKRWRRTDNPEHEV